MESQVSQHSKMIWLAAVTFFCLIFQSLSIPTQRPLSNLLSRNSTPSQTPLYFTNSTFKVLIITDTHLLDDQTVPGNASNVSRASTQAVQSYLQMEKPNFVVHLGDLVSGEAANSSDDVVGAVRQILSPMGGL